MDFLNGKIKTLYFRFLIAAFGSALITSIYSIVDMAMVGQYHGPAGTAALAVVAPIWNIIYSLGLLMGIGGSVLFSILRGKQGQEKQSNEYFTVSMIGAGVLALIVWGLVVFFDREMLMLFGADESTLALAREYVLPIKAVVPCFLLTQALAAYLRNDGNPGLATVGVLAGGIFNVFGDYFFVFPCQMGARGAGLATAIGTVLSLIIMLSHFFSKKNTLRFVRPSRPRSKLREIVVTGFSTFLIDIAMGVLTILFNRQIMTYLGTNALSIYGVIVNISTLRLQYRTGVTADLFHQLRRRQGRSNPADTSLCADDSRGSRHPLGGGVSGFSQSVHPDFYEPDTGSAASGAVYYPQLQSVFSAAAAQHLFNVLFPGGHGTEDGVGCFSFTRSARQRLPHPAASGPRRSGCHLVCHAADRTAGGGIRFAHDSSLYKTDFTGKGGCQ